MIDKYFTIVYTHRMETVPRKPATIRDVARLAGVGLGTVSRVLNQSTQVSEETRARVLEAIRNLNFVPSQAARRLSLGKTLTVSAIAPFFTRPAIIERLRGIQYCLEESLYDLIIYNVETVHRRNQCFWEVPRPERTDGVIIISLSPRDEDIAHLTKADVPIVLIDANHPQLSALNRVTVDDICGGYTATRHLLELGHRKVAYISDILQNPFNFTSSQHRLLGYQQALQEYGVSFRAEYHRQGDHGRHEARRMAEELFKLEEPPTAIFAASDTQAMGVLEAAHAAGKRVPEDLSVIGYDDIEMAEYLGLTTIRQLLYESGLRGVELLLDMLVNKVEIAQNVELPTELVVRGTTCPPKPDKG